MPKTMMIVYDSSFLQRFLLTETVTTLLKIRLGSPNVIPSAVLEEAQEGFALAEEGPRLQAIEQFVAKEKFVVITPEARTLERLANVSEGESLGQGELEAIAICLEQSCSLLANEDRLASTVANRLGISVVSITDCLQIGIGKKVLSVKQAYDLLDLFEKQGKFRLKRRPSFRENNS